MKLLITFPVLVLMLSPSLLAQGGEDSPQCASCCPSVEDPAPETVACDTLDAHLVMMEEAIEEAACADSTGQESEEVCHAITMKAIPPCMLMEGTSEQAECLAKAAQDIEEELGIGEEAGTEVVANCKCDAFKKIRKALSSVRDMMCPPSDDDRTPRNYYGYGANTLWFQYILCQQETIPSLACWLFTSGWNQADFGQYYLYDNLLGEDDIGIAGLDGDLLPLLALSGGLGGGPLGGHAYGGGHAMYRRAANDDKACPTGLENADGDCVPERKRREDCDRDANGECETDRKRREDCVEWVDGNCVKSARKRREDCDRDINGDCRTERKRREDCIEWVDGKCVKSARKRREDCDTDANGECKTDRKRREDCVEWVNGKCVKSARKRREDCDRDEDGECITDRKRREDCVEWVNGKCVKSARKRREDCDRDVNGECNTDRKRREDCVEWINGKCVKPARKRRETCPVKNAKGECVEPARKRRDNCPVKDANGDCVEPSRKP